jgi:hypothetical protein
MALVVLAACQPAVPPAYVITTPREIALQMEVTEFGPYSTPDASGGPPATEFLPRDRLRATPVFAGPEGPMSAEEFDLRWVACSPSRGCLVTVDPNTLRACDPGVFLPDVPCELGRDATLEFTLADLDPTLLGDLGGDNPVLAVATTPPIVGLVAAPPGQRVDDCLQALHEREDLGDCILLERTIPLGPLSEVVAVLEALGVMVEISESLAPLLSRPRNHLPSVREFDVTWDESAQTVAHGGSLEVPAGARVTVSWRPGPGDVERYEVVLGGVEFESEEQLFGTWAFDRDVTDLEMLVSTVSATIEVDEDVMAYLALRDDRGSESAGWLTLEVAD